MQNFKEAMNRLRQTTETSGIDFLESVPGLLKILHIRGFVQVTLKHEENFRGGGNTGAE